MVSYADYWLDLTRMADQEREETGNNVNKLLIYKELTAQIFSSAVEFRGAGITEDQMKAELTKWKKAWIRWRSFMAPPMPLMRKN